MAARLDRVANRIEDAEISVLFGFEDEGGGRHVSRVWRDVGCRKSEGRGGVNGRLGRIWLGIMKWRAVLILAKSEQRALNLWILK